MGVYDEQMGSPLQFFKHTGEVLFFLNQDFVLNTPNNETNVIYRVWDELNVTLPE